MHIQILSKSDPTRLLKYRVNIARKKSTSGWEARRRGKLRPRFLSKLVGVHLFCNPETCALYGRKDKTDSDGHGRVQGNAKALKEMSHLSLNFFFCDRKNQERWYSDSCHPVLYLVTCFVQWKHEKINSRVMVCNIKWSYRTVSQCVVHYTVLSDISWQKWL